jgi:hypothetical protein
MRLRPAPLADGITEWLRGDDTVDAEAASQILAELAVRGLLYLRALDEANRKGGRK